MGIRNNILGKNINDGEKNKTGRSKVLPVLRK
jgi:hypothetical protein